MLAGARLAADHVNEAGGIVGADGTDFQLAVVDTLPDYMEIAAANMRQARVIAVIGPEANQVLSRNMALLQDLVVPIFTPVTGDTALLTDSSNRIFRSRTPEGAQIRALADYLVNALKYSSIQTIQLDAASTENLITLANALSAFGVRPSNLRYEQGRLDLEQIAQSITETAPDAVAIYGPPRRAAHAYELIRAAGYRGDVVYSSADDPDFVDNVPAASLPGIISLSTWSYTQDDAASRDFTLSYSKAFGRLPDALSAAGYDAVQLIAAAASGSNTLVDELANIETFPGLQGVLKPATLRSGEVSNNVVITRLNKYGAANMVARYPGQQLDTAPLVPTARDTPAPLATSAPLPTETPTGYHLIVQSDFQNVRTGPGLEYDVIGQVLQGAQLRVLGATVDYSWLVIDFRGQWGWLAAYLVETFGNPGLVPIVQPPEPPTPAPTATTAPPREPDLLVLTVDPRRLTLGQATTVNVTVLNQGLTSAGNFAIATTLQPGGQYVGVNQPGLGAGQQTTVQLRQTLNGPSGPQSVAIVVDLNQEVYEGSAGEANNHLFSYSYIADRPELSSGKWTLAPGSFDLDNDANPDFSWTGNDLVAQGNAAMVLMNHLSSIDDVHYDAINVSQANIKTLNADLLSNSIVGIVTADGHRGVVRLTNVTRNGSLTVDYRVYR